MGIMVMVQFRSATLYDVDRLADIHSRCSMVQPGAFFYRFGSRFLREYYKILVSSELSVILCAEGHEGPLRGFVAGTVDAAKEFISLRKHRGSLVFAALPEILRHPSLLGALYSRNQSLFHFSPKSKFVVQDGPRISYWAWDPQDTSNRFAIQLMQGFLDGMRSRGLQGVRLEIDRENRKVLLVHKLLGARVVEEFETPDGGHRLFLEHTFHRVE